VELVAGDATQFCENRRAVRANVDIGKSRIERDGLVWIEDERPDACLKLDGAQRIRAEIEQSARCRSCPCANLERRRAGREMASVTQSFKYPFRVAGPCRMIAAGIVTECHRTEFLVDARFAHAARSPPASPADWAIVADASAQYQCQDRGAHGQSTALAKNEFTLAVKPDRALCTASRFGIAASEVRAQPRYHNWIVRIQHHSRYRQETGTVEIKAH